MSNEHSSYLNQAREQYPHSFINFTPLPEGLIQEPHDSLQIVKDTASRLNIKPGILIGIDFRRMSKVSDIDRLTEALQQKGIYCSTSAEVFEVLSAEQTYILKMIADGKVPDEKKLHKLSRYQSRDIRNQDCIIQSDQDTRVYKPRIKGDPNRLQVSKAIADMMHVNFPQMKATSIINGPDILLEEFFLGARESEPADIDQLSEEEATRIAAHALLTEDLDWQRHNFVVDKQGKLFRVDSKAVFQNAATQGNPLFEDVTTESNRQMLVERLIHEDAVARKIIEKTDMKLFSDTVANFNGEELKQTLITAGLPILEVEHVMESMNYNKEKSEARMKRYKGLLG